MNGPLLDYTAARADRRLRADRALELPAADGSLEIGARARGRQYAHPETCLRHANHRDLLGEICREAGIPDGVVNVLTGPGAEIGEALVAEPLVDKVAFTGETGTGRRIM